MKFYVAKTLDDEIIGCELTLRDAKEISMELELQGEFTIEVLEVPVSAESIRLLLSEAQSCYAISRRTIYPKKKQA